MTHSYIGSELELFAAATNFEELTMSDYIWTGAVSFLLLVYLLYALLKPEKF